MFKDKRMLHAVPQCSIGRIAISMFCLMLAACGGGGAGAPAVTGGNGQPIGTAPATSGEWSSGQPGNDPPSSGATRIGTQSPATAARFNRPDGMTLTADGNLYVVDSSNHTIRRVTPEGSVTTVAGSVGAKGSADGIGAAAQFNNPGGIAADAAGNLYVADTGNHVIRKIAPTGMVTTLAGTVGAKGNQDGAGTGAQFNLPSGIVADDAGNLYVADTDNYAVRKITATGLVSTVAGIKGTRGAADGDASSATFRGPLGITLDASGNLYVTDVFFYPSPILVRDLTVIRKVTPTGLVSTLAGGTYPEAAQHSDGDGSAARFSNSAGIVANPVGGMLYVADTGNHTIRKVTQGGTVSTPAFSAPDGSAARHSYPRGIVADDAGNLYLADAGDHVIRKVTPGGLVTTYAGKAGEAGSTDAP